MRKLLFWVILLFTVALVVLAATLGLNIFSSQANQASTATNSPPLFQRSCERPYSENYRIDCFHYRTHKQGGFELPLVLISQKNHSPNLPRNLLVKIPGGPGQGGMTTADETSYWVDWLEDFDLQLDLLIYDPRATYGGKGHWQCEALSHTIRAVLSQNLSARAEMQQISTQLTVCLDAYRDYLKTVLFSITAAKIFSEFTTDKQAADVIGMIKALGYHQAHLWGVSYGTRVALFAAHSDLVKTLLLDSVYPFDKGSYAELIGLYNSSFEIHEQLYKHYVPDSNTSFRTLYSVITSKLDSAPIKVSLPDRYHDAYYNSNVRADSQKQTSNIEFVINSHRFLELSFGVLYYPNLYPIYYSALMTYLDDQTVSEDWVLIIENFASNALDPYFNTLAFYSTECLDNPPDTAEHIGNTLKRHPDLKDYFSVALDYDLCAYFSKPEHYTLKQPYADKPTLIFAGAFDPITPLSWAEALHRNLPRSQLIVAKSAAHGPLFDADCDWKFIENFIRSADFSIPVSCRFGEL